MLYSGDPHIDSHIERKFYAAEIIEIRRWSDLGFGISAIDDF